MPLLENFLNYLTHQKRYSKHTTTAYQTDITQFLDYISEIYSIANISEVNTSIIRSWMVHLLENKTSPNSINRKLSSLKTFFKYLQKNEVITENPLNKIVAPKTKKRLPVFVKETELDNLFDLEIFENNLNGKRDKLIIELLYSTGIRLSELIGLKINSVSFSNNTIKVLGKRNKERIVPFSNNLKNELLQYLDLRKNITSEKDYFFLTNNNKKLYPKFVYRLVNTYLSLVTKITKKSPHVLRHTFATHMLNNGADLNAIKEILGHSNLSATQVYTHNTIDKLKNIHKQAHPKA